VKAHRDMLGEFVLPAILVVVCLLHLSQRELQSIPRQQTLVQVVPGAVGQERPIRESALDVERALCCPSGIESKFVGLPVQRSRLPFLC
jgi:hypothetical protein